MSRLRWLLVVVVAVSAFLVGSSMRGVAGKPARSTHIVAFVGQGEYYAVDSAGQIYKVQDSSFGCSPMVVPGQIVGNLFGGPAPSPVVSAARDAGSLIVCLEDGSIYGWCTYSGQSSLLGNVYTLAGQ